MVGADARTDPDNLLFVHHNNREDYMLVSALRESTFILELFTGILEEN